MIQRNSGAGDGRTNSNEYCSSPEREIPWSIKGIGFYFYSVGFDLLHDRIPIVQ